MANEMDVFVKLLSIAKCLRSFGVDDLRNLLSISSKAIWKAGDEIFIEGDQGRDMYILCSGKVNIWRKNGAEKVSLANLAEGESFGEMGLIRGGARSANASAVAQTIALRINQERLHQVPSTAALLYKNLARELAEKLHAANDTIVFQSKAVGTHSPEATDSKQS
jgi:CRP-like cAMP-binding protein